VCARAMGNPPPPFPEACRLRYLIAPAASCSDGLRLGAATGRYLDCQSSSEMNPSVTGLPTSASSCPEGLLSDPFLECVASGAP